MGYQNTNENLATIQLPKRRLAITESQRVILSLRLDFFYLTNSLPCSKTTALSNMSVYYLERGSLVHISKVLQTV